MWKLSDLHLLFTIVYRIQYVVVQVLVYGHAITTAAEAAVTTTAAPSTATATATAAGAEAITTKVSFPFFHKC